MAAPSTKPAPGERVELHPGTDAWMQGDRYGVVKRRTRYGVRVAMDRSRRVLHVADADIFRVIEGQP